MISNQENITNKMYNILNIIQSYKTGEDKLSLLSKSINNRLNKSLYEYNKNLSNSYEHLYLDNDTTKYQLRLIKKLNGEVND